MASRLIPQWHGIERSFSFVTMSNPLYIAIATILYMAANTRNCPSLWVELRRNGQEHDGGKLEHAVCAEQLLIQHRLLSKFFVLPINAPNPLPPPQRLHGGSSKLGSVRDISSFPHIFFPVAQQMQRLRDL